MAGVVAIAAAAGGSTGRAESQSEPPCSYDREYEQLMQTLKVVERKIDDAAASEITSIRLLVEFLKAQAESQDNMDAATTVTLNVMCTTIATINVNVSNLVVDVSNLNKRITSMYRTQLFQRAAANNTNRAVLAAQERLLAAREIALNLQQSILNAQENALNAQLFALAAQRTALATQRGTLVEELAAVQAELENYVQTPSGPLSGEVPD